MDSAKTALQNGAGRLEVSGIIEHVDTFGREVELEVEGAPLVVNVPVNCPILLREERVKLRFLQAGDRAHITCCQDATGLVAESICVNWLSVVPHRTG